MKYLARYTHRVAISNARLLSMQDGRVSFGYKDYADGNKSKVMTLDAVEFIRRFLLHVLPGGFVRIRQFGYLANRARKKKLALCRTLPDAPPVTIVAAEKPEPQRKTCPACKTGHMVLLGIVRGARLVPATARQDSS